MKKLFFLGALVALVMAACAPKQEAPASAHPEWTYNTVVYEMNIRQLTPEGTFNAATERLPFLKELGVDIIWCMPIYPIGEKERKGSLGSYYAISDYCAANPEFGTMEDFEAFLAKAHELGLKVILDWVANHTSPDAKWTADPTWHMRDAEGNTLVQYDWYDIARLNYENQEMRKAMTAALRFWLEKGVDGFRCDVAGEVPTDYWKSAWTELKADYPEIYLLAEAEKPELHTEGEFQSSYAWEYHHILNAIANGGSGSVKNVAGDGEIQSGVKSVADLKEYIARDAQNHPKDAFRLMFTSNHDENSWNGTEFERMGDAVKAMTVLNYTLPNGQPLIYTGQEFGYDHRFLFFDKDPMPVMEPNEWTSFYREMNAFRHANAALMAGEKGGELVYVEGVPENVLAFSREVEGNKVIVVVNLSAESVVVNTPCKNCPCEQKLAHLAEMSAEGLTLGPWGYSVCVK
uniref:alpha-amylase family glycosyl hydrolase n=1 Tax=Alistipes sp. TaxID=1872444 RepID=UPI004055F1F4